MNKCRELLHIRFFHLFIVGITLLYGCSRGNHPFGPSMSIDTSNTLFASVDGNRTGLWVFDSENLSVVDSILITDVGIISHLEFSRDYNTVYTLSTGKLKAISLLNKTVVRERSVDNTALTMDRENELLIVHNPSLQFFDEHSFYLIHDSELDNVEKVVVSPADNLLFGTYPSYEIGRRIPKVFVFDMESYNIVKTMDIILDDSSSWNQWTYDINISPDGRYLFVTVSNTYGPYNGSFHVINLLTDSIVAEYPCAEFASISISPDGNYVYLSNNPSFFETVPLNQILRYNIKTQSLEVFIDGLRDLNLDYTNFYTGNIVISNDNSTLYISLTGVVKDADGNNVHLLKLDSDTKEVLSTFRWPEDYRGYHFKYILKLWSGRNL